MSDDAPRRLHPGTVGVLVLRRLPSTLVGLPAFLAIFSDMALSRVLLVGALLCVLAVGGAALSWWRTTYRVTDDAVVIDTGLVDRRRRTLPLERIQDVDVERGPLHRLLGLALVRLETGGAGRDEGLLDSVSLAEAHRLQAVVRGGSGERPAQAESGTSPAALFAMPLSRVVLAGVFNFSLVWIAAAGAVLQYADQAFGIDWERLADTLVRRGDGVAAQVSPARILALAGVAVALGLIAGIGSTLLRDYRFRLLDEPGALRRSRGLLTRSEVTIARRRVQLALLRTGWLRGRFGWSSLALQTLGGADSKSGREVVVPFGTSGEIARVLAVVALDGDSGSPRPVSRRTLVRPALAGVVAGVAAIVAASLWRAEAALLLPVALLPPVGGWLRWQRTRWALGDGMLHLRTGGLTRRCWIVPVGSIQSVAIERGVLQRALDLATVVVDTAGASARSRPAVCLRTDAASALARALLGPAATDRRAFPAPDA